MTLLDARTEFVQRYGLYHLVKDSSDTGVEEQTVQYLMNQWMVSRLAGVSEAVNDSGLFAYEDVGTDSLKVTASATPDYNVTVNKGACFIKNVPVHLEDDTVMAIPPVTSLPRIDYLTIDTDGMLHLRQGTPSATPEAPAVLVTEYPFASITHRVGETKVTDTDDATNAYITNIGVFVNA